MTLLHYIALILKEKYPELANFYNELHFVDKAAAGEHYEDTFDVLVMLSYIRRFSLRLCTVVLL